MRNKKKFNEFMNKTIDELKDEKRYGTAHIYQSTLNAFSEFCGCEVIYFHQLNRANLKEFETYLRDKQLSWNTVSTYMRTLRATYNKAVDKKIITENSRLFHHVYTGVKNDIKRALEVEEINKLLNEVPLKKLPEDLIRCRVWANLMFQLRGMPFVDLAHLHKSDLKGNTLSYRRYKTGGQMIVDIPITAMKLINKYQNTNQDSPYLFPILSGTKTGEDLYTEYQQALRTMNYNLGRLAKKCGVATKVSSYTTRHTWATLAKYCKALADAIPVSPKGKMIYLVALILGVALPVAVIYIIELFKYKIEGRADVEKITSLPIVGDVPFSENKSSEGAIVVHENQNDLMAETFRNVRTNVLYMMKSNEKVILVTSTTTGEGKTFIASNLAVSLALLGKKIVIVGLDIRKPSLNKAFNLSHREQGISQFLANPEHTDLMSLVQVSRINANLSILPGGPIPPNPTELVARESLPQAIDILKKHFDYIILDTAPIGMVTDTLLISRVANASIYVCRADYTHKADYTLINELGEQKKLPNLCTIINGLDMKKKKYGYYYGYGKYGKYYGYGKKYGYGYGYGAENVNKK